MTVRGIRRDCMKRAREEQKFKATDHLTASYHAQEWLGRGGGREKAGGTNHGRMFRLAKKLGHGLAVGIRSLVRADHSSA